MSYNSSSTAWVDGKWWLAWWTYPRRHPRHPRYNCVCILYEIVSMSLISALFIPFRMLDDWQDLQDTFYCTSEWRGNIGLSLWRPPPPESAAGAAAASAEESSCSWLALFLVCIFVSNWWQMAMEMDEEWEEERQSECDGSCYTYTAQDWMANKAEERVLDPP